ncbi:MAG: hypothetical protein MJA83_07550, partial [Gammaproteobacteria bacterium]|nr:hypothetical protein [Gammaproteobacteria bacterium]
FYVAYITYGSKKYTLTWKKLGILQNIDKRIKKNAGVKDILVRTGFFLPKKESPPTKTVLLYCACDDRVYRWYVGEPSDLNKGIDWTCISATAHNYVDPKWVICERFAVHKEEKWGPESVLFRDPHEITTWCHLRIGRLSEGAIDYDYKIYKKVYDTASYDWATIRYKEHKDNFRTAGVVLFPKQPVKEIKSLSVLYLSDDLKEIETEEWPVKRDTKALAHYRLDEQDAIDTLERYLIAVHAENPLIPALVSAVKLRLGAELAQVFFELGKKRRYGLYWRLNRKKGTDFGFSYDYKLRGEFLAPGKESWIFLGRRYLSYPVLVDTSVSRNERYERKPLRTLHGSYRHKAWMGEIWNKIKRDNRTDFPTLIDFIIPGTHDSMSRESYLASVILAGGLPVALVLGYLTLAVAPIAIYVLTAGAVGVAAIVKGLICNQTLRLPEQARLGVRAFDVRVGIGTMSPYQQGAFYGHHGGFSDPSQRLIPELEELNGYLDKHPYEIVILYFGSWTQLKTFSGSEWMTDKEIKDFMQEVFRIFGDKIIWQGDSLAVDDIYKNKRQVLPVFLGFPNKRLKNFKPEGSGRKYYNGEDNPKLHRNTWSGWGIGGSKVDAETSLSKEFLGDLQGRINAVESITQQLLQDVNSSGGTTADLFTVYWGFASINNHGVSQVANTKLCEFIEKWEAASTTSGKFNIFSVDYIGNTPALIETAIALNKKRFGIT